MPFHESNLVPQQTIKEVSRLERAIARVLLLRYEQDICRLYSARLHNIALIVLPKLMYDTVDITSSPGWVAANADCDEIKDFFRSAIAMDLRQAGERVATKSVLWSYTALRHFVSSLACVVDATCCDLLIDALGRIIKIFRVLFGRRYQTMCPYARNAGSIPSVSCHISPH